MATGATDEYWQREALPGVYKHALLRRYLPVFGGKTGSHSREVVFLDGYAGRGRHADGTPGSAELILQTAESQAHAGISWRCFFFETDPGSYRILEKVVDEYVQRGVATESENSEVEPRLGDVLKIADGLPLFLFLDPCGLGLPYDTLVKTLNAPSRRSKPTEVLLNFSMEAVRRIGGHITSTKGNEATLRRLDDAVGGDWWRTYFEAGEHDPDGMVAEFVTRLARDTNMGVRAFPVRRAPHHKPIYYLVFGTRSNHGVWAISDSAAKAADEWRERHAEDKNIEGTLFDIEQEMALEKLDADAIPDIAANIERLITEHDQFRVLDYPTEILGSHVGEVRNAAVRKAIKRLYEQGKITSYKKGLKIEELIITRPEIR